MPARKNAAPKKTQTSRKAPSAPTGPAKMPGVMPDPARKPPSAAKRDAPVHPAKGGR